MEKTIRSYLLMLSTSSILFAVFFIILSILVSCSMEEEVDKDEADLLYLGYLTNRWTHKMNYQIVDKETETTYYSDVLDTYNYIQLDLPAGEYIGNRIVSGEVVEYIDLKVNASNLNQYTFDGKQFSWRLEFEEQGIIDGNGVTDIDGNTYKTVIIGEQEWMAENLRTTRLNDGENIPEVPEQFDWLNQAFDIPAYCWYNNDISNQEDYGALYNWHAVNTNKLCPDGWRAPSYYEDWPKLYNYIGGRLIAGKKLKRSYGWHGDGNGTDKYGFSAMPGGTRTANGSFSGINGFGNWWTSTEQPPIDALYRSMSYESDVVGLGLAYKYRGFSVRCIKE